MDVIDPETDTLMREQFAEGATETAEEYEALTNLPVPTIENKVPETSFFGVNERRMNALLKDTQQIEKKASTAALRMMDDIYRQTLHRAEVAMAAGATTLPKAIDMAVQDFLRAGITCIEYKNGRRVNIADYAEMALRTAATRSKLQGDAAMRAKLGVDTVLVSQYGQCSETCLPWQGRVYIDDVFGTWNGERAGDRGKSVNGNWYPLLSVAVENGLFHPNCRHTLTTWYEGVSTMPKPLDPEKIKKNAALEQKQRALERKVRQAKRLENGCIDPEDIKKYAEQRKAAQKELREFIAEHSDVLRRDPWKEKVASLDGNTHQSKYVSSDQLLQMFHPTQKYKTEKGEFDLNTALNDYRTFLTTVPEKNRIYLQQGIDNVGYVRSKYPGVCFGFLESKDNIYFNPDHPDFWKIDFIAANTHELAHRIDYFFVESDRNKAFQKAISDAKLVIDKDPKLFIRYCQENDRDGFLSDILDAVSEGTYDFPFEHDASYWKNPANPGVKEKEIFANLFSLETFRDEEKISFIRTYFSEILNSYRELIF